MGKNILFAFILVAVSVGLYAAVKSLQSKNIPPENIACTAEAKICPDGSAVGRTGPNCEFAACSTANKESDTDDTDNGDQHPNEPVTLNAKINETVSAFGVQITPLEVLEDSRCPEDVVCIWAGTVKVRAMLSGTLGETEQIFELRQKVLTEKVSIILTDVRPVAISTEKIEIDQYQFEFVINN
jgi:hypothetical protein